MSDDAELEQLRAAVNCAAVLERISAGWRLDVRQSTGRALKYRRGEGEVLIVNHDGRGWWDPMSEAKGDVFALVQHLDQSLNFGQVRKLLRPLVGIAPLYPETLTVHRRQNTPDRPVAARWTERPCLQPGSPAWIYLTVARAIPPEIVGAAAQADAVREGRCGSAWFAHRRAGEVTHVEVRGPDYKGSLRGGQKTLFRFGCLDAAMRRIVIAEAPIDALSVAALEHNRGDTIYVATGGGMGPGTLDALIELARRVSALPNALITSAADANTAGNRYAERHAEIAAAAGIRFDRKRPPQGLDWNNVLQKERGA